MLDYNQSASLCKDMNLANYFTQVCMRRQSLIPARRNIVLLLKRAVKHRILPETALQICLCRRSPQRNKLPCLYESLHRYIFSDSGSSGFLKNAAKIRLADIKSPADVLLRYIFRDMTIYIVDDPAVQGVIHPCFGNRAEGYGNLV